MSYSSEKESNSLSLAMFASVGLHGVLFVSMALFPAASETVEKPLRIVNLLPPDQLPAAIPGSQANTSTLQDILNNPLPDLSAGGLPPLGNTDGPIPAPLDENASSYVGGANLGGRVKTNLDWTNPPIQSETTGPVPTSPVTPSALQQNRNLTPSSLTPAPATPRTPTGSTPASSPNLPPIDIPQVSGAVPSPFGAGASQPFSNATPFGPGTLPSSQDPAGLQAANQLPASRRTIPRNISESVPYAYPQEACANQLKGTVTIAYFRGPDGDYTFGSQKYENKSDHAIFNKAAVDAVSRFKAVGTGDYQSYTSRFDFTPTDAICSAAGSTNPVPATGQPSDILVQPKSTDLMPSANDLRDDQPQSESPDTPSPKKSAEPESSTKPPSQPPESTSPQKTPQGIPIDVPLPDPEGDRTPAPAPQPPLQESPAPVPAAQPAPPSEPEPLPAPPVPPAPPSEPVAPSGGGSASDLAPEPPVVAPTPQPSIPEPAPAPPAPAPASPTLPETSAPPASAAPAE